jgi:hypothetical protein
VKFKIHPDYSTETPSKIVHNENTQVPPIFKKTLTRNVDIEDIDGFSITSSNVKLDQKEQKEQKEQKLSIVQPQPPKPKYNTVADVADRKRKEPPSARIEIRNIQAKEECEEPEPDIRCETCLKGDNEDVLILCDECGKGWHIYCHPKRLQKVPKNAWLCFKCYEKLSNKLMSMIGSLKRHKVEKLLEVTNEISIQIPS